MSSPPPVPIDGLAFFGGGTGGHIFPGIAVAERARERFPGCRVIFHRTERAVETRVFEGTDFEIERLAMGPPGRSLRRWIRYVREAIRARRRIRPLFRSGAWVAFGLGGYASVPGILEARRAGVPVILLEQNRVVGRANGLFSPFVSAVSCSYPDTRLRWCRRREVTGNPVRAAVLRAVLRRSSRAANGGKRTVLVVGGSQGAHGINRAIRDALPGLSGLSGKIRFIHVAGDADKESMTEAYRTQGWEAEVLAYSPDLPDLMAGSDLVVSRAGGTTLAELAVLGLPSVLVPYPHHRDRHQLHNARSLADRDAARLVDQTDLNAESLRRVFEDLLFEPERLEAMARGARSLARPDAADAVLDLAEELRRSCPPVSESSS